MNRILYSISIVAFSLGVNMCCFAQDKQAQYPAVLSNSYFGAGLGYIGYSFSKKQLEPGYNAEAIRIPHGALKVVFGHHFNKYLSVQLSYMRPFAFVEYRNVNGGVTDYEVGMNVAGLSVRAALPLSSRLAIEAEAGLAVITRGGFIVINAPGVKDAVYASIVLGGGIQYKLNDKWSLVLNTVWSPANEQVTQPATVFYNAGFNYTMRKLPASTVARNSGFAFPGQTIQVGYTTGALGYGVNRFLSKDAHVFWGGAVQVNKGISINYLRNIFHSRKVFSLDWAVGASYWQSRINKEEFVTLSVYPVFRFTFLRSKPIDFYLSYSFGGPAFISKSKIDQKDTGEKVTLHDVMGLGFFSGKKRTLNAEIRIGHFSNGNIFPQNNGVMIPLTFVMGYSLNH